MAKVENNSARIRKMKVKYERASCRRKKNSEGQNSEFRTRLEVGTLHQIIRDGLRRHDRDAEVEKRGIVGFLGKAT